MKCFFSSYRWPSFKHLVLLVVCLHCSFFSLICYSDIWVYSIKKGDNLWDLTVDYLKDISYVKKVQELNKIEDPWQIAPGKKILIPAKWLRSFPMLVRAKAIQGRVELVDDETGKATSLKPGQLVIVGDTIRTAKNSSVVLEFMDGTRLLLEDNSELKIDYLAGYDHTGMTKSRLFLKKGRLETQVAPKKGSASQFKIRTPNVVTSVRGTDFRVSAEPEKIVSSTEVLGGGVGVSGAGKTRLIPKGFSTIAIADQPPTPPIKLLPAPDTKKIPDLFSRVPVQFKLPELPKHQSYRVQIAKSSLFNAVLFNKIYDSGVIRTLDLPDGKYVMRIRGIDQQGLEGVDAQMQFRINARPEPPFLIEPKSGVGILESSPNFIWAKGRSIRGYHFQLAKNKDFSPLLFDIKEYENISLLLNKPLPIGKYYWRVAAIDEDGDGPFSDPQLLRRILPAPEMEAPEMTENTVVVRFRQGLTGQKYHIQVARDEKFKDLMADEQLEKPEFTMPKPESGDYYVRIQTLDPDGFVGPFSSPQLIEVPGIDWYWVLVMLPLFALFAL